MVTVSYLISDDKILTA